MAADGFFPEWYAGAWFPVVWFAPGDESHLTPAERRPEEGGTVAPLPPRARIRRTEIDAAGRTFATAGAAREALRAIPAHGATQARIPITRERLAAVAVTGRTTGAATLRGESTPIFRDDELMALAAFLTA